MNADHHNPGLHTAHGGRDVSKKKKAKRSFRFPVESGEGEEITVRRQMQKLESSVASDGSGFWLS